jgi:LuxR family transcriptional regulator, maltose regulon positive regulatory protein
VKQGDFAADSGGNGDVLPFRREQEIGGEGMETITGLKVSPSGQLVSGMPKITMPSLFSSHPRRRLFARLNKLESFPLIWISAPAGYGKTTAINAYLRDRRRPVVWYQCDEGDGDVGSFFHYVTLARNNVCDQAPVPTFLSQYLSAAPSFCRNFFREWFAGLPPGSTLVLDNWQDVPAHAELRHLLPIVAEQLPHGLHIIVISRDEPDSSVSRLIVGERLAQLGIEDLQLSKAETRAIALARSRDGSGPAAVDIEALYEKTQGWAAAVTLLLRHGDTRPAPFRSGPLGASQAIFDYLAAEAFERLSLPFQKFLMSLACLEHIAVPVAERVSGCDEAATILETLTRQNVFTSYRASSNSYHFHPLFRSFLQRKCQTTHTPEKRRELLLAAASSLNDQGEVEAGIQLLLQARTWNEAGRLIRHVASTLVDQARLATLSRWIEALPVEFVADDAWLVYWRGICRLTFDFQSALGDLEHSYERFLVAHDRAGQALACAAILQHIAYSYLDYRGLLPWIQRLERLLKDAPQFSSSGAEIKVRAAFMLAVSQGVPSHPRLIDSVAEVAGLVHAEKDIVSMAEGVSALLHFFSRFGRTPQYGDLDRIVGRLLDDPALPPLHRLNLLWLHAYQLHSSGDPARVMAILREARALARHEGLHSEDTRMRLCELQAQEGGASNAAALSTFSELEPYIRGMPAIPRAHFLYVRSIFELGCGNLQQALKYGQQAVPLIRASHWHIGEALALTGLAEVYCAAGRVEDAAQCIQECALITQGVLAPLVEFNLHLVRAELARICRNNAEFEATLAQAFAIGREQGYANGFHTSSQLLRRLIPYGLELGIEPSYCRWVIAKRRFAPSDAHRAQWPWPVKIRAMGRLRVYLDDQELIVKGKAQRKPLEILKLLTAYPDGVEMCRVMDELWPDLEGDAARNALDIALHRLRKILKSKDAVRLTNGTLSLNKDIVWLDTEALDRIAAQQPSSPDLPTAREEILELYKSGLLGDEELGGTLRVARDRLRNKFVRRVSQLAKRLEDTHQWEDVTSLYRRAIDREPTEELLHRGLMRALREMERDRPTRDVGN